MDYEQARSNHRHDSHSPRRGGAIDGSRLAAKPGAPAPAFGAPDIGGRTISLGDYAGKIVILEWTNDGCPFVGKHYESGNMQALQRKYTGEGDVWLTIASSAPGEQGYVTPAEAKADLARWRAAPSDFLLDPDGVVGRLYDARATPNMVVIDRSGRVAYMGAIDDTPSTRLADVKTAKNYLVAALDEIAAGKPVTVAATQAYGCSIKYKGAVITSGRPLTLPAPKAPQRARLARLEPHPPGGEIQRKSCFRP